MKRRTRLFATIVLLGAAVLAGCGGKDPGKADNAKQADGSGNTSGGSYNVDDYVTLGEYKGLSVKYLIPEVTDDDFDMYVEELQEENTEYTTVEDRGSKNGDTLNIDFAGTIDGEAFEGGSAEEYDIVLGEGEFLEELEAGMVGKKTGETMTIPVTFPEDYDDETLAGKKAEFTVTINSITVASVPEYNEAFVKKVSSHSTMKEFEEAARKELLESATENSKLEASESALFEAVEQAALNGYPQELYDTIYNETVKNYQDFAEIMQMEYQDFLEEFLGVEDVDQEALEKVNETLVVQAIAKKEGIEISDQDYKAKGEAIAEMNQYGSLEEYEEAFGKEYVLRELLRQEVLDFLYDSAKLEELSMDEYYEDEDYLDEESGGEEVSFEEGDESFEDEELILDEELEGDGSGTEEEGGSKEDGTSDASGTEAGEGEPQD